MFGDFCLPFWEHEMSLGFWMVGLLSRESILSHLVWVHIFKKWNSFSCRTKWVSRTRTRDPKESENVVPAKYSSRTSIILSTIWDWRLLSQVATWVPLPKNRDPEPQVKPALLKPWRRASNDACFAELWRRASNDACFVKRWCRASSEACFTEAVLPSLRWSLLDEAGFISAKVGSGRTTGHTRFKALFFLAARHYSRTSLILFTLRGHCTNLLVAG